MRGYVEGYKCLEMVIVSLTYANVISWLYKVLLCIIIYII